MVDFEWNAQPIEWRLAGECDFAALLHLLRQFRSAEQGFAGSQDVFDETGGGLSGCGSGFLLVDEIGKADQLRFGIVNGDREVAGGHEFIDDAVGGGEELLACLRGAGLFGDAIESGAERFGALALRDVTIDGVEGDSLAADDQGRGGDGDVDQRFVMAAALGFESDLLAAPQASGSPIGFRGAVGRDYQRIDGLAHGLGCGITKHALELAVHALGAEGGIEYNGGIGRALEQLFEIPAAEIENSFGALWLRTVVGRMLFYEEGFRGSFFCGIPGERRRLDGGVGKAGRDERGWGSALESAAQSFSAYDFPRLRYSGDTITHSDSSPSEALATGMVERGELTRKLLR